MDLNKSFIFKKRLDSGAKQPFGEVYETLAKICSPS